MVWESFKIVSLSRKRITVQEEKGCHDSNRHHMRHNMCFEGSWPQQLSSRLEGVWPPITVKTDIRIYGTVVSMDPFRAVACFGSVV